MTVEEMATALLEITERDEVTLRDWAEGENAAFEAYASAYVPSIGAVCKGCHGG